MSDKIMVLTLAMAGILDRMVTLGIEYEKKNLTHQAFAESIREILIEYQRSAKEFNDQQKAKENVT